MINPTQRPLTDNTQHLEGAEFATLCGIETKNPKSKKTQTHVLESAVTAIGCLRVCVIELQVMKAVGSLINIVNCILRQADDIQTVVLSGCKSCSVCMSRRH